MDGQKKHEKAHTSDKHHAEVHSTKVGVSKKKTADETHTLDLVAKLREEPHESGHEHGHPHHKKRHSSVKFNPTVSTTHTQKSAFQQLIANDPNFAKYLSDNTEEMTKVKRHRRKFKIQDPLGKAGEERKGELFHGYKVKPEKLFKVPFPSRNKNPLLWKSGAIEPEENVIVLQKPPSQYIIKKLSLYNDLKVLYSRKRSSVKPHRRARLTKERAKCLFGTFSKLAEGQTRVILRMYREETQDEWSNSLLSGSSNGPDYSWIQEYSEADFLGDYYDLATHDEIVTPEVRRQATASMFSAFAPLWYALIVTGRSPFGGGVNHQTGFLEITFSRKSFRFLAFCFTSLVIFLMMTLSVVSTVMIFDEFATGREKDRLWDAKNPNALIKDNPNKSSIHPYVRLEILHLEKQWQPYTLFLMFCLFMTFCNVVLIVNGKKVARMIAEVVNTSVSFQIDGSQYIWITSLFSQAALLFVLLHRYIFLIWKYTSMEDELNSYMTISTTRLFFKEIRTNLDVYPIVSPFIFFCQSYAIYAGSMQYVLPTILSLGISNIAQHWNFRLALILGRVPALSRVMKRIKNKLTYSYLFRYHLRIRDLIRDYSTDSFGGIITAFYAFAVAGICTSLYRFAKLAGVSFDRHHENFTDLSGSAVELVNIKTDGLESRNLSFHSRSMLLALRYVDPIENIIGDSVMLLLGVAGTLVFVNEILARVARSILEGGFSHVRRHGLVGCRIPHERRFILSLYKGLSARNACMISPGNWFQVDRRFLIAILEMIMIIFTTMIQASVNPLIKEEIVGLCDTGVCIIGYVKVNARGQSLNSIRKNVQGTPNSSPNPVVIIEPSRPDGIIITTTTTEPNPILDPFKNLPILDPALNLELYQRCPTTDVARQLIFTRTLLADGTGYEYVPVPLPTTSVTECIIDYYRPKNGEEYYDALGNKLDTYDKCGIPSLPMIKYLNNAGITKNDLKQAKYKKYSKQEVITTQSIKNTYQCQEEEELNSDITVQEIIFAGIGKYVKIKPWKPLTCGMPALFVDVYCQASQEARSSTKLDDKAFGANVAEQLEIIKRKDVTTKFIQNCNTGNPTKFLDEMKRFEVQLPTYGTGLANDLIIAFELDVPDMPNIKTTQARVWFRQNYRLLRTNQESSSNRVKKEDLESPVVDPVSGQIYPSMYWGRLKKTLKTIFLPYPHRNEGFLYDCFAQKLDEYDECGFLPFSIVRKEKGKVTRKRPNKIPVTYEEPGTKVKQTVMCWEHQFQDYHCGLDKNDADINVYLHRLCSTFQKYQNGLLPTEFITED